MTEPKPLSDADYTTLADFRQTLRGFYAFSERQAVARGLTPQQYQALLAIRGARGPVRVGDIAERLVLKPHSASGLLDRLESLGLVERRQAPDDRRQALLSLTPKAQALMASLSATHREELLRLRPLLHALLEQLG